MEMELVVGWVLSLLMLGFFYWRSRKIAIADRWQLEQRLTKEITTIKNTAHQTESLLQAQLKETISKLQTSEVNKAQLEEKIIALTQQCQRLREEIKMKAKQVQLDMLIAEFEQLQTLLTQYPSVRKMVESQPNLPARNIVALLTPLENLVKFWGCKTIGKPWETVEYDAQFHQGDAGDIKIGETVYVRFIGYQKGDRILIPAKVSRTLPTGAKS